MANKLTVAHYWFSRLSIYRFTCGLFLAFLGRPAIAFTKLFLAFLGLLATPAAFTLMLVSPGMQAH